MTKEIIPCAGAVIINDRKVLLIKRGKMPKKGYWNVPGGTLEEGESFEICCKREIAEELGIDIQVGSFCYEIMSDEGEAIYHLRTFFCQLLTTNIVSLEGEVDAYGFFTFKETQDLLLTIHTKNILLPKLLHERKIT